MRYKAVARRVAAALLMASVMSIGAIEPALAQATGGIENVLENIVSMLTGNVAKLLATIAVIIVGIAWMFGYLDLRKAAYVVLGIGIIFGASEIVSTISGV
ncbi:TrbC/VirB2 family protein [Ensifer sp. IC3342]|nr:TrbC/VirB2 family protein [Ensifer sp. BRP08]MCA1451299.1 TrbC/VirB2 family protein [Ensifer sp. IC3342]